MEPRDEVEVRRLMGRHARNQDTVPPSSDLTEEWWWGRRRRRQSGSSISST